MTSSVIDDKKIETANHPHRMGLCQVLASLQWVSIMEMGCGEGANISCIVQNLKKKQAGGIDLDPQAIESCNKRFNGGVFKVGNSDDVLMSDKATDITLTDMHLSTIPPRKIKKHLEELRRMTRKYVVLCELAEKPIITYLKYRRWVHNYPRLLEKLGYYDIATYKFSPQHWTTEPQRSSSSIFVASVPKRY